jgi:hypothetical protein
MAEVVEVKCAKLEEGLMTTVVRQAGEKLTRPNFIFRPCFHRSLFLDESKQQSSCTPTTLDTGEFEVAVYEAKFPS